MFVFQTNQILKAREAQFAAETHILNIQQSQAFLNNGGKQAIVQMYKGMGIL